MNKLILPPKCFIPTELVDIIADFHDFHKYCKPNHEKKYKSVMEDIICMNKYLTPLWPRIAKECWGSNPYLILNGEIVEFELLQNDLDEFDDQMVGLYDEENDDEENNYGMDYDDTYYYGN